MSVMIGATVFFGAACFALLVTVRMVRGYWPLIVAALNGAPLPRTMAGAPHVAYRRRPTASLTVGSTGLTSASFTPRRLAQSYLATERAAA